MTSLTIGILWVHLLAAAAWLGGAAAILVAILPALDQGGSIRAIQRAHFLTSRAMEILLLTGILNVVVLAVVERATLGPGFRTVVGIKAALLVIMAGFQIWMGIAWKLSDIQGASRKARLGLGVQLVLGSVAALLGMTLRPV